MVNTPHASPELKHDLLRTPCGRSSRWLSALSGTWPLKQINFAKRFLKQPCYSFDSTRDADLRKSTHLHMRPCLSFFTLFTFLSSLGFDQCLVLGDQAPCSPTSTAELHPVLLGLFFPSKRKNEKFREESFVRLLVSFVR